MNYAMDLIFNGNFNECANIFKHEETNDVMIIKKIILPLETKLNDLTTFCVISNGFPVITISVGLLIHSGNLRINNNYEIQIPESAIFRRRGRIMLCNSKYSNIGVQLNCSTENNNRYQVVVHREKKDEMIDRGYMYDKEYCSCEIKKHKLRESDKLYEIYPINWQNQIPFENVSRVEINEYELTNLYIETHEYIDISNIKITCNDKIKEIDFSDKCRIDMKEAFSLEKIKKIQIIYEELRMINRDIIDHVMSDYLNDSYFYSISLIPNQQHKENNLEYETLIHYGNEKLSVYFGNVTMSGVIYTNSFNMVHYGYDMLWITYAK